MRLMGELQRGEGVNVWVDAGCEGVHITGPMKQLNSFKRIVSFALLNLRVLAQW